MILLAAIMVSTLLVPGVAAGEAGRRIDEASAVPTLPMLLSVSEEGFVGRLELRSFEEGISEHEMEAIMAEIRAKAIAKGLLSHEGPVQLEAEVTFREWGVVVAFGYVVGADGGSAQYVGRVRNRRGVEVIHQAAREWCEEELQRPLEVTTTASSPEWGPPDSWTFDEVQEPYGRLDMRICLRELRNDGDPVHSYFAVSQDVDINPGINITNWHSDWRSDTAYILQHWGWSPIVNRLEDWDPHTIHQTSSAAYDSTTVEPTAWKEIAINIAVGIALNVIWHWAWMQPPEVMLIPDACTHHFYGEWSKIYQAAWAQQHATTWQPGSAARVVTPAPGTTERLILMDANARFRDPHWWGGACYRTLWLPLVGIRVRF
ncbi:MAG: hypothetical protein DDT30_01120 [Dehalococcoidia bacterium]|nr:hypothetical protein [Bacillota bacterium]MBT9144112.1 hypothetical protein [Bacillota bacterium]